MRKGILAIIGFILFSSAFIFYRGLETHEKKANILDDEKVAFGIIDGPLPCAWEVVGPERVMSEDRSQAIVVNITNQYDEGCEAVLSLRAPSFDLSPAKEEQKIVLNKGEKGSLSWIISPRKTGSFEISVSDPLVTKIFGISVTTLFGLTAFQAKIGSVLGGLFGPMLTVPWWWERVRQRKQKGQNSPD